MGVTVHYRGTLDDLGRVEDFEDRVIDLALAVGGECRLWRSADDSDPGRVVRGLILNLAPGQESTSLLISPEGWLIGLVDIEDAEKGQLLESPWCFVKTQFASVEGHVVLVELLTALKAEFISNLEVSDEGNYWEHRNLDELKQKLAFVGRAIDTLADALQQNPLSSEAAEDPQILATRIERLAGLVHATLSRPAEHAPVTFPDDELGLPVDPAENEARWDELYRENRRRQERMERTFEEEMLLGADDREALESALEEASYDIDDEDQEADELARDLPWDDGDESAAEEDDNQPWSESLTDDDAEQKPRRPRERHPLLERATQLWMKLHDLGKRADRRPGNLDLVMRSAGDMTGGLAQALPLPPAYELDDIKSGLALVQLKRALRGAAFVHGGLFLLRSDGLVDDNELRSLAAETDAVSTEIVELLRTIREAQL